MTVDVAAVGAPPSAEGGGGGPIRARVVENGGGGGAGTAVVLARVVRRELGGRRDHRRPSSGSAAARDALELEASVGSTCPRRGSSASSGGGSSRSACSSSRRARRSRRRPAVLGARARHGDAWIVVQAAIDMQPMTEPATAARVASGLASGLESTPRADSASARRSSRPRSKGCSPLTEVPTRACRQARQRADAAGRERRVEQALGEAVQRLDVADARPGRQAARAQDRRGLRGLPGQCADFADQEVHAITNPAKTVSLLLDISGSMSLSRGRASRIQAAQASLLKVFDEHISTSTRSASCRSTTRSSRNRASSRRKSRSWTVA